MFTKVSDLPGAENTRNVADVFQDFVLHGNEAVAEYNAATDVRGSPPRQLNTQEARLSLRDRVSTLSVESGKMLHKYSTDCT